MRELKIEQCARGQRVTAAAQSHTRWRRTAQAREQIAHLLAPS
jgi:hypothetical protein